MEVLEGILPTPAVPSEQLFAAARSMREGHMELAAKIATEHLTQEQSKISVEPATALSNSPALRDQVASFADAGILFYHSGLEFWRLNPAERAEQGGNAAVTRVFVADERLLLETSRVIVRFMPDAIEKRGEILERHHLVEVETAALPADTVKAAVLAGEAREASLRLMKEAGVVYAEPDFIEQIGQRYTPAHLDVAKQWHHTNLGSAAAWDHSKGDGIAIAVIDNGFDVNHPDLKFGPLSGWFRPTADQKDADFVAGTQGMADKKHGTACAGMISTREGSASGGCGIAFRSRLSMIACLVDQVGPQSTLASAIGQAAGLRPGAPAGCDIISCSLGPSNDARWTLREVLADAIEQAATRGRNGKGCAIFWACTNGNFPISSDGVCSHPDVIAVGRSTQGDSDDACGFGKELEFLAPGVKVWIPTSGGIYQTMTGTSFAAPCAAGVAALALAANKALTARDLRQVMRESCDKVGSLPYIDGRNLRFGYGRINAEKAVAAAKVFVPTVPTV
ncbi:MAG: hypothetical protein E6G97_20990 [Alphaproteobacteria bacterium]|nr:MAG: hypothetical protein E6G97_20990 [Alphaproteobacteria bacterium]